MKKIEAVIYSFEWIDLWQTLNKIGIEDVIVSEVKMDYNLRINQRKIYKRGEYDNTDSLSKIKLEIAVEPYKKNQVRDAIQKATINNNIADIISLQCNCYEFKEEITERTDKIENMYRGNVALANIPLARTAVPSGYNMISEKKETDNKNLNIVWKVAKTTDPNVHAVTVISKSCPGIFSKIAGVFTLNDFDILHARCYRQQSNTLDIFKVRSLPGLMFDNKKFVKAEAELKAALAGRLNLSIEFRKKMMRYKTSNPYRALSPTPPRVAINNDNSLLFSMIEIEAKDFPGLLFSVTDALFRCGLNVWMAKISTQGDQVSDAFYVKDRNGEKIETALQMAAVKSAITEALSI